MKTLTCKFLFHRDKENISLHFDNDGRLLRCFSTAFPLKWSRQHKCWYCGCTKTNFEFIRRITLENSYSIDYTLLTSAMAGRSTVVGKMNNYPLTPPVPQSSRSKNPGSTTRLLSMVNQEEMDKFTQHLVLKSYSQSTIRTYTNELTQFFAILKTTAANTLESNRMKDYLQYCHKSLHLSGATLHSRMNALKFYYEQVLHKEKFFWEIPRPKKPLQLPRVFNQEEVADIINSIENKKHKVGIQRRSKGK